jgi:hypothetical protein
VLIWYQHPALSPNHGAHSLDRAVKKNRLIKNICITYQHNYQNKIIWILYTIINYKKNIGLMTGWCFFKFDQLDITWIYFFIFIFSNL